MNKNIRDFNVVNPHITMTVVGQQYSVHRKNTLHFIIISHCVPSNESDRDRLAQSRLLEVLQVLVATAGVTITIRQESDRSTIQLLTSIKHQHART
jgi:hypothetical protein